MWIGDSLTDLEGSNPCTVEHTGAEFHCTPAEKGSAFGGSLHESRGQLTIEIAPCPGDPAECRATYVRDPTLTCD